MLIYLQNEESKNEICLSWWNSDSILLLYVTLSDLFNFECTIHTNINAPSTYRIFELGIVCPFYLDAT